MTDTERERINAICEVAGISEIDDLSDGFHTFRQLYYQRMMLFATIVKQNKDKAWKSLRHEDGELCFDGGWFIVGIDTPEGSYTYHYENKYFDLFDCEILDYGKHWDGHTEKDVTRLLSLPKAQLSKEGTTSDLISRTETVEHLRRVLEATVPNTDYDEGYIDGIEFGISTVSTMPTIQPDVPDINDGNLISRQQAIDAVEKNACNTQRIIDAVNNLPPAQPEPTDISAKEAVYNLAEKIGIHQLFALTVELRGEPIQPEPQEGEWIPVHPIQSDDPGAYMCSKCKTGMWEIRPSAYHYCPNCGAKMKGAEHETD